MTNAGLWSRRIDHIESESWWFVWLALTFLFGGFAAIVAPMLGRAPAAIGIGGALAFIGLLQLIHSSQVRGWSGVTWQALIGIIILAAGVLLLVSPVININLAVILGIAFLLTGVAQVLFGRNYRPNGAWAWILVAGILAIIVGILIMLSWPPFLFSWETSSAWAPGLLAGISLMFSGWAYLMLAAAAMRLALGDEAH